MALQVFLIYFLINSVRSCSTSSGEIKLAPSFSVIPERTSNGAPSISVAFPDGYTDTLILSKFYGNEEDRTAGLDRCHYFGHLANEPKACIAMTGCVGFEDVEFTILSNHAKTLHMFKWTKDGNVEILDFFKVISRLSEGLVLFTKLKSSITFKNKAFRYIILPKSQFCVLL